MWTQVKIVCLVATAAGCVVQAQPGSTRAGTEVAGGGGGAALDRHSFEADEYVVYGGGSNYGAIAKLVQAPSEATKGDGKFLVLANGNEIWTRQWWRSRPAEASELQIGMEVICFQGENVSQTREDIIRSGWHVGKVTDLSNLYQGWLTVSGPRVRNRSESCQANGVRIVTASGTTD